MAFGWGGVFQALFTVAQAYQQYQAGREEEKAAEANAALMRESAEATRRKYALEETQRMRQAHRLIGSQKAAAGSSGLTIGSFEPIYAETLQEAELDALAIRQQSDTESRQYEAKADIYAKQGKQSRKAGMWGAGGTLLEGYGKVSENYKASKRGTGRSSQLSYYK